MSKPDYLKYDGRRPEPHYETPGEAMTTDTPRTDALETQCERENMTRDAPWELARTLERALRGLYEETADYIRINNLGDVHHNRSMQRARDALDIDEIIGRKP